MVCMPARTVLPMRSESSRVQTDRIVGFIHWGRISRAFRAVEGTVALPVDLLGVPLLEVNCAKADSLLGVARSRVLGALALPNARPASLAFPLGVRILPPFPIEPAGRIWSRCVYSRL